MLNFFLKRNQLIKLDLIQLINSHENIKKTEIMEYININRSTLERTILELNNEIKEQINNDCYIESSPHKNYYFTNKEKFNFHFIYHSLKLSFLKSSTKFVILKELLTGSATKITSLSRQLSISTSYCYKLIRDLKKYLLEFDLKLVIHNKNGSIQLIGDEANIRMFTYVFLTESFQNLEWPFRQITISEVRHLLDDQVVAEYAANSEVLSTHLYYIIAIFQSRIKNRFTIDLSGDTELRDLLLISDTFPSSFEKLFQNADFLFFLHPLIQEDEQIFFNFFLYTFLPSFDNIIKRQEITDKWVATPSHLTNYAIKLTEKIAETWHLSPSQQQLHSMIAFNMYSLILASLFRPQIYQKIKDSFSHKRISLFDKEKRQKKRGYDQFLKNFLAETPSPFSDFLNTDENFRYYCGQICILVESALKRKVKLFLQYEKNASTSILLYSKITQIFGTDTVSIVTDFHEADCVISNHLLPNTDKEVIFFNDIFDPSEWQQLLSGIQTLIWKTNFEL